MPSAERQVIERYAKIADRIISQLQRIHRNDPNVLLPMRMRVDASNLRGNGYDFCTSTISSRGLSSGSDSFYEYLVKEPLLKE